MRKSGFNILVFCLFTYVEFAQTGKQQVIPKDTSFTPYNAWINIKNDFPTATIVKPQLPVGVLAEKDIIYTSLPETPYGKRDLHLDLFYPDKTGSYPALILVFGGGWHSGNKCMQVPMAQKIAAKGYVTAAVEYRLSTEAIYPAAVYDIKAAIRFLRANAEKTQKNDFSNRDKFTASGKEPLQFQIKN